MLRRVLPFLLLILGAGGLAALAFSRPAPQPLEAQEKVWTVEVLAAAPRSVSPTLTLYAQVDSPRAATLTAAVDADVIDVPALEGRSADAGDLLIRLDDRDATLTQAQREADVAELRAELSMERRTYENDLRALEHEKRLLDLARRDVKRAERLATRDLGSAAGLDEARQQEARQALALDNRRTAIAEHDSRKARLEARLDRAQALVAMARLDVERTRIRAPFSGRIASVAVSPGDRVRRGSDLLSLFDSDSLELRAQIPTRYLGSLRQSLDAGRDVLARASVDGQPVSARLDRLGARVERGRGGADGLFTVDASTRARLELGRTVEMRVALAPVDKVVSIPAEALYGTNRLYLLEDGRMRGLRVERLGEVRDDDGATYLLVRSDALTEGATIIATQLPNAVEGLRVRAAER